MIDGVLNNAPSLGELEAKAKAGEQISLTDLAAAVKAEEKAPKSQEVPRRKTEKAVHPGTAGCRKKGTEQANAATGKDKGIGGVNRAKFENMDVIAALEAIMHQNTAYYQSDFAFDIKMLREAARSDQPEDKLLLWLSRPSGTFCFRERDVLLKDTASLQYMEILR